MTLQRGDIYYAKLDPVIGRETGKTRPVLIVQNDIGNTFSPTTIIAVITEYSEKKASYPICVPIPQGGGLRKQSIVNLSQIRTIDKSRLVLPRLTHLSQELMSDVERALRLSLAL
ncbi:type II toxin-antitoxin system PemK/MazF family toxin [Desulfonatronum thiodismutans]|uniref:type II toxin-antitoxin system PemK/MazF family toxin n=1 Tax=Desulfonatronum thiodismutans TaxID=159290 RepID=UPI0004ABD3DE|nr:type II toxin-antitoxin system PemK/MazF family toxin [Desulfonatronum thiodismutans]